MDLAQQRGPLVPADPIREPRVGPRVPRVGSDQGRAQRGEVPEPAGLAKRAAAELGQDGTEVERRIAERRAVEVEYHQPVATPQQWRGTEIAGQERRGWRDGGRFSFQPGEGVPQHTPCLGNPLAHRGDTGPNLLEDYGGRGYGAKRGRRPAPVLPPQPAAPGPPPARAHARAGPGRNPPRLLRPGGGGDGGGATRE